MRSLLSLLKNLSSLVCSGIEGWMDDEEELLISPTICKDRTVSYEPSLLISLFYRQSPSSNARLQKKKKKLTS